MKKKPDNKDMSITRSSAVEYLTFVAAQGKGGVEVVYADEDIWLTQKMMGVLYDVKTHTINYHLKKVFADNELAEDSVIRRFRITAADGKSCRTGHTAAEDIAQRQIPRTMQDWETHLNRFIEVTVREILHHACDCCQFAWFGAIQWV